MKKFKDIKTGIVYIANTDSIIDVFERNKNYVELTDEIKETKVTKKVAKTDVKEETDTTVEE